MINIEFLSRLVIIFFSFTFFPFCLVIPFSSFSWFFNLSFSIFRYLFVYLLPLLLSLLFLQSLLLHLLSFPIEQIPPIHFLPLFYFIPYFIIFHSSIFPYLFCSFSYSSPDSKSFTLLCFLSRFELLLFLFFLFPFTNSFFSSSSFYPSPYSVGFSTSLHLTLPSLFPHLLPPFFSYNPSQLFAVKNVDNFRYADNFIFPHYCRMTVVSNLIPSTLIDFSKLKIYSKIFILLVFLVLNSHFYHQTAFQNVQLFLNRLHTASYVIKSAIWCHGSHYESVLSHLRLDMKGTRRIRLNEDKFAHVPEVF